MLPCETKQCAYREHIPGDQHISCHRKFTPEESQPIHLAMRSLSPRLLKWFLFPYNFDPVWGPDDCPAFSTLKDPEKVKTFNAEEDFISLLGKHFF
jgi:hypothetical protein